MPGDSHELLNVLPNSWAIPGLPVVSTFWLEDYATTSTINRIFRSDNHIRVCREPRQELLQLNVQVCDRQAQSLQVWAGISSKTVIIFLKRNVTADTDGDLRRHLFPSWMAFGGTANCVFQDDDAAPHRTAAVRNWRGAADSDYGGHPCQQIWTRKNVFGGSWSEISPGEIHCKTWDNCDKDLTLGRSCRNILTRVLFWGCHSV